MFRCFVLVMLMLALSVAAFGAGTTVVLDGKSVSVPAIESNGKVYLDAVSLMQLLGGKATYSAAAHKVSLSMSGSSSSSAAGTSQLAGGNGELGKVYTVGKDSPLYVSLTSAEFTTEQVRIGSTLYAPRFDEKLLLLRFAVQNPQKNEVFVRGDSFKFTAVDSMNVNHEDVQYWGDADNHHGVEITLKPAQKMALYTVITVPAKGVVPKLMLQPTDGSPVVRYDLRDKVIALKSPIADPSDTTGSTALESVPAKVGDAYPYQNYVVTVEKFAYTTTPLNGDEVSDGSRFLVVTLLTKNMSAYEPMLRADSFVPSVADADGVVLEYRGMLAATANRYIEQNVKEGQEMRVRLYFIVPKDVTPKTFTMKEDTSRSYVYSISE